MVERITAQADRVALLPRPGMRADLRELLGHETDDGRSTVIPEGVHAATVRDAAAAVAAAAIPAALGAAVAGLADALDALPAWRRSLPLVVTVGRLHPMKGIDRIVAGWVGDAGAARRTRTSSIVGGDLDAPSPDELDVLATIEEILAGDRSGRRAKASCCSATAPTTRSPASWPRRRRRRSGRRAADLRRRRPQGGVRAGHRRGPGRRAARRRAGRRRAGDLRRRRRHRRPRRHDVGARPGRRHAPGARPVRACRAGPRAAAAGVLADLTIERMAERLVDLYRSVVRVPS